jgi:alginate O-acetyltransferase complex protein AlgI
MQFNSLEFFLFFLIVAFLYFKLEHSKRWMLLLFSSYYFYMSWNVEYAALMAISSISVYFCALGISRTNSVLQKKAYLAFAIVVNFGMLVVFKYFNFVSSFLRDSLSLISIRINLPLLEVLLPVGISFFTFQALGYIFDVYMGKQKAEKHLGIFALYVSFFPQLVAGPIERAGNLLPQFFEHHRFSYNRATDGLKLILLGLFKKIVVADRLAFVVNQVYSSPTEYSGFPLIFATVFFAFQIYCDFSGYCDIALGAARILGFRLTDNFRRPYYSINIQEFWRRWHITLSSWFKDYVYIPLGGNRVSMPRWYFNIMVVFLVCGFWHGASWTFVAWGALHGLYMVLYSAFGSTGRKFADAVWLTKFPTLYHLTQVALTFALVCFSWIFFRANTLSDAFYIASHLFAPEIGWARLVAMVRPLDLSVALYSILVLELIHFSQENERFGNFFAHLPRDMRWVGYALAVIAVLLFGVFEEVKFIYFQF